MVGLSSERTEPGPRPGYCLVIPIKGFGRAKSRLLVDDRARVVLARAFAADLLAAAGDAAMVADRVVVTDDPQVARLGEEFGTMTLEEPGPLNAAVDRGREWARVHRPNNPIAVLPADLPALTGPVLDTTLQQARKHDQAYVADAGSGGTTLLTARRSAMLRPAFGPASAHEHRRAGAVELIDADPRIRRDVDTLDDLRAALALEAGSRTMRAIDQLDIRVDTVQA